MEESFWRDRWREGRLGWHRSSANPMLVKHLPALGLESGARVFVPLCGKTLDIGWLRANGFRVVGAELVESAVAELFEGLGIEPEIDRVGPGWRYRAEGIDVFVGDLFGLTRETLGPVDACYDRAALVALPDGARDAYAAHVATIADRAPQLLISYAYDQSLLDGPPFSVADEEVRRLAEPGYEAELLERVEVEGGMKGVCPATETAWALRRRG